MIVFPIFLRCCGRPRFFMPMTRSNLDSSVERNAALPSGRPVAVVRRISNAASSDSSLR